MEAIYKSSQEAVLRSVTLGDVYAEYHNQQPQLAPGMRLGDWASLGAAVSTYAQQYTELYPISDTLWQLPPPAEANLMQSIANVTQRLQWRVTIVFQREGVGAVEGTSFVSTPIAPVAHRIFSCNATLWSIAILTHEVHSTSHEVHPVTHGWLLLGAFPLTILQNIILTLQSPPTLGCRSLSAPDEHSGPDAAGASAQRLSSDSRVGSLPSCFLEGTIPPSGPVPRMGP